MRALLNGHRIDAVTYRIPASHAAAACFCRCFFLRAAAVAAAAPPPYPRAASSATRSAAARFAEYTWDGLGWMASTVG